MSEEEMKALVEMNKMLKYENNKLKQQLQAYKDKYSDLETDYAKAVENEKTLIYTCNKYYDELQVYKDKEDRLREYVKSNWVIDEPIKFKNDILQILNEGGK